jgi:hypothetical protein
VCCGIHVYWNIQGAAFNVTHFELAILLVCVVRGVAATVVGFRVALDSMNDGALVRAAAHILCGTVRVKQVDRIHAANVSSEFW